MHTVYLHTNIIFLGGDKMLRKAAPEIERTNTMKANILINVFLHESKSFVLLKK